LKQPLKISLYDPFFEGNNMVSHIVGNVVLSTTLPKDQRLGASTGTEDRVLERESKGAQFMAAEKGGEGRRKKSSREQYHSKSLNKALWDHGNKDASPLY
jgi:hypothetical protein